MADVQSVFVLFLIGVICGVRSDCHLSLNKDFGSPTPVYIRNGKFLAPDADGSISLRRSETLTVACPGTGRRIVLGNDTSSYDTMEASCIINSTFRVDRRILPFQDIKCSSQPYYTSEDAKQSCAEGSKVYRVGYKVKSTFYPVYSVCYDKYLVRTLYAEHRLSPLSMFMQNGRRPNFIEGSLFGKIRMSTAYKASNQKSRLDVILGANESAKYITKSQFLSRGHLAARADYAMGVEWRATFHYANCAPQWQRGNAGDWAALEDALRRRVQALGTEVMVYTGTHGVMTLPDKGGHMKEFYLLTDENNNGIVPVPMYYYKLVYNSKNKTAAAFISINSSFYNKTMTNDLQFCDDICDDNSQYSWLSWRSNDGTHSFCCNYQQFVSEVDYLPKLEVKGLFY